MKEKEARYKTIKQLISKGDITAQEELQKRLNEQGFQVTQATLSRDLKALRVGKAPGNSGGYIYTLPDPESLARFTGELISDVLRGFVSIDFSGNLGVIKTHPGHAASIAFAFDNLGFDEILGTVAGDDTIILVIQQGVTGQKILKSIAARIPELKEKLF
ncbi:MAG: ArgR family transcriptional regulator [Spirochaetales bacterium]|nr:ArgR family transcriptional regulator [Spirochaetales bacterium]